MPNANVGRRILDEYDEYKYQVKIPMQDLETGADIPLMVEHSTYQLQINRYYIDGILSDYTNELRDKFLSAKPNGVDSIMNDRNKIVDTYLPEYVKAKPDDQINLINSENKKINVTYLPDQIFKPDGTNYLINSEGDGYGGQKYYLNPYYLPSEVFLPDGTHPLIKRLNSEQGTKYVVDSIYLPDMDYVSTNPDGTNPLIIEAAGQKYINKFYIKGLDYVKDKPDGTNYLIDNGKITSTYLPNMDYVPTAPNSSKGSLIDSSTGLINSNYLPSSATGEYVPLRPDGTNPLVNGSKINAKYLPDMDYVPSSPDETHPLINGSGYLNTTTYLPNDFINSTGDNSLTIDKSAGKYNICHTNSATGVHATKKFGYLGNNNVMSFTTADPQTNVSNDITTIGPETEFRIPYFTYNSKGHIVDTIDKRFRFSTTSVTGEDVRVKRLYPTDSGLVIDFNELVGLDEDTPITYYVYSATGVREVPYVYTNTKIRNGIYTSSANLSNMNEYNVNLDQYSFILTVDRLGTNGVRSNLNQIVQTLEVLFYNTSGTLEGTIKRYRRTRVGGYWNDWSEIDYVEDAWEPDNEGVGLTNPVSYGAVDTRFRSVENNMNGVMGQLTSINNFIEDLTIDPETGSSSILQTNVVQYYDITGDANYVRGGALDLNSLIISNLENKCIRKIYYHGYFNNPSVSYTNIPDDYASNSTASTEYSIVVVVDKIWESVVSSYPVIKQTLYITKRFNYFEGAEYFNECKEYQRTTSSFNNNTNGYSFGSWKKIATTDDISNYIDNANFVPYQTIDRNSIVFNFNSYTMTESDPAVKYILVDGTGSFTQIINSPNSTLTSDLKCSILLKLQKLHIYSNKAICKQTATISCRGTDLSASSYGKTYTYERYEKINVDSDTQLITITWSDWQQIDGEFLGNSFKTKYITVSDGSNSVTIDPVYGASKANEATESYYLHIEDRTGTASSSGHPILAKHEPSTSSSSSARDYAVYSTNIKIGRTDVSSSGDDSSNYVGTLMLNDGASILMDNGTQYLYNSAKIRALSSTTFNVDNIDYSTIRFEGRSAVSSKSDAIIYSVTTNTNDDIPVLLKSYNSSNFNGNNYLHGVRYSTSFTYNPSTNLINVNASGVKQLFTNGGQGQNASSSVNDYPVMFGTEQIGDIEDTETVYGSLHRDNTLRYNASTGSLKTTTLQATNIKSNNSSDTLEISGTTTFTKKATFNNGIEGNLTGNLTGNADTSTLSTYSSGTAVLATECLQDSDIPLLLKSNTTYNYKSSTYMSSLRWSQLTYNPDQSVLRTSTGDFIFTKVDYDLSTAQTPRIKFSTSGEAEIFTKSGYNECTYSSSGAERVKVYSTENTKSGTFNDVSLSTIYSSSKIMMFDDAKDNFKTASVSDLETRLVSDNFRKITYGTSAIEKDSTLATGTIYLQYEN